MRKLRIATMVSGHFTTPPPEGVVYAPMDIALAVSEGLAKRGHEVYFYAPEGSRVNVTTVVSDNLRALKQDGGEILKGEFVGPVEVAKIFGLWDQYLIAQMFQAAAKGAYDILHIHPVDRALPLALSHLSIPVVYTLHDPIYSWRRDIDRMFASPNQHYISISNAQRKPAPDLNYLATIYNGIDLSSFPFSEKHDDYLLFVGRLHPEKGVAEAVEIARRTGQKLIIAGPPVEGEYWEKKIAPYLGGNIEYIGHVPKPNLYKYYGRAKATLVPIQWEEPFGLVMTESMACGTPVIAFRRGSVPEVVRDGATGFIVDTIEEMVKKVYDIKSIDRRVCRGHVEKNFSVERMVSDYEKAFLQLVR